MSPKRSGLQRPPGFLFEPGGGGQSRLRVPLVPQKKDPRAGGRVCPREPRSPPTGPRGSLEAEAVPVLQPPKSTQRGAPSPRPPRRPRRGARAASRCRCSPAGRSREPRAGPGCLWVFLAWRAHRPTGAPGRAAAPGTVPCSPGQVRSNTGRPRGEKAERRLLGRDTEPRRKHSEATSPLSFLCSSGAVVSDPAWEHPSEIPSRGVSPGRHTDFKL
uniref:Uncharacterized protein n=1 Tax=Myotis myotis TaxID=51298 RepID=A0A7J7Y058_MYOMY|nr:hypothetical protein mMyoMyo1_011384 [Myotis myotis]